MLLHVVHIVYVVHLSPHTVGQGTSFILDERRNDDSRLTSNPMYWLAHAMLGINVWRHARRQGGNIRRISSILSPKAMRGSKSSPNSALMRSAHINGDLISQHQPFQPLSHPSDAFDSNIRYAWNWA